MPTTAVLLMMHGLFLYSMLVYYGENALFLMMNEGV